MKMRMREKTMRPFWEGGEGRLLGDMDIPEEVEGVPEELVELIKGAKEKRTRPGEPGRIKGMGTEMLMLKVPEAGQWQWDVLEVRAVEVQEAATSHNTGARDGGQRGGGEVTGGKAKRQRRR